MVDTVLVPIAVVGPLIMDYAVSIVSVWMKQEFKVKP